ncbi:hypothetical protein H5407_02210 [Mitsuaria sp. WAJ17]|uniref:hypothetical protein n=1 Tax=Mitsuaria sp. WAJ17 TaxID=2761452 RepID=UPI001602F07D|nr:hypothetical protein [Mitsuaria sp. WAJ17]MBB2484031.1 hypothetical protein [Mitsuaria sp. WAJ17]
MSELWRCTVTGSSLCLPHTRSWFHGLRAQQRSPGSLYLTEPGSEYNLPFGRWGDPPFPHVEAMHTPAPVLLHMAEPGVSASDLALSAARALLAEHGKTWHGKDRAIDILIYCHSTSNEDIADAIAGRLQYELGLTMPLVFCLSQNLCSALMAIRLATALLQEEPGLQRALIVASEKWIHPFVRSFGHAAVFEDGAAAVLIERAGGPGWQLGEIHHVNAPDAPSPFESTVPAMLRLMGEQVPRAIRGLLETEGVASADLGFVVQPRLDASLCAQVLKDAGLEHLRPRSHGERNGHLASAEALANLHELRHGGPAQRGQMGLLWGVGLQGEAACCLLGQAQADKEAQR